MATVAQRPPTGDVDGRAPPEVEERDEAPGYEALRQILRVVLVVSLALTAILAVFPVFGMLLLPALFAALAYVGLMIVSRLERQRWKARHPAEPAAHEVGLRVVTGGAAPRGVDRGDATVDQEVAAVGAAPARVAGAMSHGAAAPPLDEGAAGSAELFTSPQRAGGRALLKISAVILVMAAGLIAAFFDWRLLGVEAVLIVAYMALFGMPVWLASAQDAAEAEKERRLRLGRRRWRR